MAPCSAHFRTSRHSCWACVCWLVLLITNWAYARGPGLGNLTYTVHELFQPISLFKSPHGHGNVAMVNGYLMVIYSSDGGGTSEDGGIEFWNVADPRRPKLVVRHDTAETHGLREAHGFAFSTSYPGTTMVAQAMQGLQFWDLSDPWHIRLLQDLALPGIIPGDYSGTWWVFWQAPYVYVAGTGSGLYVVDATDPARAFLVTHVPTSELGGLIPGQVFAIGNLLILMENPGGGYATMDISDPTHPTLIQHMHGKKGYSHVFAAGQIFTVGGNGERPGLYIHRVTHEGQIAFVGGGGAGLGNGGYGTYQDGMFHAGFSDQYAKFDVTTLTQLGTGSSGIGGRDEDFGTVLGNLVFVGDDHGVGSALIVHQITPDTTGPAVHWIYPPHEATHLPVTTRVGVSMSDHVDLPSVNATTFMVRPLGGSPLSGKYSVQMGVVNFAPAVPLQPHTTYEVVVSGMQDYVGNRGGLFSSRFTTGGPAPFTPGTAVAMASGETPTFEAASREGPLIGAHTEESPPHCTLSPAAPAVVQAPVRFTAETLAGSPPRTYTWDFGDGGLLTVPAQTAVGEIAVAHHAYSAPGRYSVMLTINHAVGRSRCATVQIIHTPLSPVPAVASSSIMYHAGRIFTVNPDNDSVTAIDERWLIPLWEVEVGRNPRTLAMAPDGHIWVVNQDDATISVLRADTGSRLETLRLPFAARPYAIAFSPDGSAAYVTLQGTGRLVKLDTAGHMVGTLDLGPKPRSIAITGDAQRILVTRFISAADHGEIYEVEAATFRVVRILDLAFDPGPDTETSGRGVPNYLGALRISPDGRSALVPSKKDNVARGLWRDRQPFTFESLVRTIVFHLDLTTSSEKIGARIDLDDRNMAQAVLFSPLGDIFFVATQGTNKVEVYDTHERTRLGAMNTGLAPQGMVFNRNASQLYVHNFLSRTVSVFDTTALIGAVNNTALFLAEVPTVRREKLPEQVLGGKQLFYTAADPRLNRDGYISCASCHLDGESDGQVWDFTQRGEGLRNTMTLRGHAGAGQRRVHWTANFDEIQDFEHDIREGFGGTGFLSDADFLATRQPLGVPKAGRSTALDALAAYVTFLTMVPPSPYRNADGTLTDAGQAGRQVFLARRCPLCHGGPDFTDRQRHDVGTIRESSGQGGGQPLAGIGFQTPTLKGLWDTAPYLHNGQAATLVEVLENPQHGDTAGLTATDMAQLVAYLLQIDENEAAPPVPAPEASALPVP